MHYSIYSIHYALYTKYFIINYSIIFGTSLFLLIYLLLIMLFLLIYTFSLFYLYFYLSITPIALSRALLAIWASSFD